MNILYLYTKMGFGGAQDHIINLAKEMNKTNEVIIMSDYGDKVPDILNENIRFIECSFDKRNILVSVLNIIDICKKNKIEILHSHHRYTTMLANIVKKVIHIKVVHSEHNVFPNKNFFNFRGDNIIAVSKGVKENLIRNSVSEKKIKIIYNGIDENKYINVKRKDLKKELNIKKDEFCFGFIGRISEQKGIMYLLESFGNLIDKGINCKLIIIGDGPQRENVEKYIKRRKLIDYVFIVGFRNDVINIVNSLDIYVLPSIYEGFPITNMEIMINKKIVIATDVGGNKEIIENDYNGFLIKSRSVEELEKAMYNVLNHQEKLIIMGENAKNTILENFTLKKMCYNYHQYYNDL